MRYFSILPEKLAPSRKIVFDRKNWVAPKARTFFLFCDISATKTIQEILRDVSLKKFKKQTRSKKSSLNIFFSIFGVISLQNYRFSGFVDASILKIWTQKWLFITICLICVLRIGFDGTKMPIIATNCVSWWCSKFFSQKLASRCLPWKPQPKFFSKMLFQNRSSFLACLASVTWWIEIAERYKQL